MAKLSDLSDAPLDNARRLSERAEDFLDELQTLLDDERFRFASETLTGIRDSVQAGIGPTPKQYLAVRNIRESVERRGETKNWGRRYEGYGQ